MQSLLPAWVGYMFTGGAIGAAIAFATAFVGLGWTWVRAAQTEMQSASTTAEEKQTTRRLADIRENLQIYYVAAERIVEIARQLPTDASQQDLAILEQEVVAWRNMTYLWIKAKLGDAASIRFLDRSIYPARMPGSGNQRAGELRIALQDYRQNLMKFIETDAWVAIPAKK